MPDPDTFCGFPARTLSDLNGVALAVLGADAASPYKAGQVSHAAGAPAAIRKASALFGRQMGQFDYDLGRTIGTRLELARCADLGDIPTDPADPAANRARITETIRAVLDAGAVPLVLGGDDSVPIPVFAAYEGRGPLTMVQVDAHVDWGDVISGNPYGFGSPMRRASEMPWFTAMVQVGIRGLGSGTEDQLQDARAWGSHIVSARMLRRGGVQPVLDLIPPGSDILLSIDCDGLDTSVLPAVNTPTPGGLDFIEVAELLQGVAGRGRIRGCNLVELVPARDADGMSALVAARIGLTAAGLMLAAAKP